MQSESRNLKQWAMEKIREKGKPTCVKVVQSQIGKFHCSVKQASEALNELICESKIKVEEVEGDLVLSEGAMQPCDFEVAYQDLIKSVRKPKSPYF